MNLCSWIWLICDVDFYFHCCHLSVSHATWWMTLILIYSEYSMITYQPPRELSSIHYWNTKPSYVCNIGNQTPVELCCVKYCPCTPAHSTTSCSKSAGIRAFLTSGHSDAQPWAPECPDVKNYKWQLNPVWHRMLYSCNNILTVGVKGLMKWREVVVCWQSVSVAVTWCE